MEALLCVRPGEKKWTLPGSCVQLVHDVLSTRTHLSLGSRGSSQMGRGTVGHEAL